MKLKESVKGGKEVGGHAGPKSCKTSELQTGSTDHLQGAIPGPNPAEGLGSAHTPGSSGHCSPSTATQGQTRAKPGGTLRTEKRFDADEVGGFQEFFLAKPPAPHKSKLIQTVWSERGQPTPSCTAATLVPANQLHPG